MSIPSHLLPKFTINASTQAVDRQKDGTNRTCNGETVAFSTPFTIKRTKLGVYTTNPSHSSTTTTTTTASSSSSSSSFVQHGQQNTSVVTETRRVDMENKLDAKDTNTRVVVDPETPHTPHQTSFNADKDQRESAVVVENNTFAHKKHHSIQRKTRVSIILLLYFLLNTLLRNWCRKGKDRHSFICSDSLVSIAWWSSSSSLWRSTTTYARIRIIASGWGTSTSTLLFLYSVGLTWL